MSTISSPGAIAKLAGLALAGVALALALLAGAASVSAQQGGATYSGTIGETNPNCGGGTIDIVLNAEGTRIVEVRVDGAIFGGVPINDLTLPGLTIDIAADGSFNEVTDLLTFSGTFDGNTVSGSVDVPAVQCNVTFSGTASEAPADGDEPVDSGDGDSDGGGNGAEPDSGDGAAAPGQETDGDLPTAGTGPVSGQDGVLRWVVALGLAGVVLGGAGLALARRRA
jgi:hypothetical protein